MLINSKKVQYFVSLSNVFLAVVSILSGSSNNGNMKDHKPELKVINITDVLRPKKLRQIAKTGTVDKKRPERAKLKKKKVVCPKCFTFYTSLCFYLWGRY